MSQQSRNKGASAPSSLHPSATPDQATAAHRLGNLSDAERAYTTILRGSRTHPVALHMLVSMAFENRVNLATSYARRD
jgi:protein O-GlcNAc transferase